MKDFSCIFKLDINSGSLDLIKSEFIPDAIIMGVHYPRAWVYLDKCELTDEDPVIPIDVRQEIDDDAVLSEAIYNARIIAWDRLKQIFLPMANQYEVETGECFVS